MKKIFLSGKHLTWGINIPNKKRYAASMSGPWHDTMQSGDIYCCDWNYTTNTWGEAYKFKGQDGKPGADGTDGDPAAYLRSINVTEITKDDVKSPHIMGGRIEGAEIWGGKITSGTTIDVTTDAKIGNKLILRADNFANGVSFCHDDGRLIAEIFVDPVAEQMSISCGGGLVINGKKYSPHAVFA